MAHILVAEDDELARDLVRRALETRGHAVTTTADGTEALAALQVPDSGYDLLLADIKMPVMDGIALALQTARQFPDLPVVLMTGYADQKERAHGLDAIVSNVVAKPFTVDGINAAVTSALAGSKGA